jgi:hypothetical protein
MFVSCTVFALSGRGLCEWPIPRPEESCRLWCVSECDQVEIKTLYTYCKEVGRRGKDYETNYFIRNLIPSSHLEYLFQVLFQVLWPNLVRFGSKYLIHAATCLSFWSFLNHLKKCSYYTYPCKWEWVDPKGKFEVVVKRLKPRQFS